MAETKRRPIRVLVVDDDPDILVAYRQVSEVMRRGQPGPLQPPVDNLDGYWSPAERAWAWAAATPSPE